MVLNLVAFLVAAENKGDDVIFFRYLPETTKGLASSSGNREKWGAEEGNGVGFICPADEELSSFLRTHRISWVSNRVRIDIWTFSVGT